MIIKELTEYAKRIVKKGNCQVVNSKLITRVELREGQGVLIDGKKYTYKANQMNIPDGDYELQTLPIKVFGASYSEHLELTKQYLPITNDIILCVQLPFEEEYFSSLFAKSYVNFAFISKAVISEKTAQAKLEGSFSGFLEKEVNYFIDNLTRYGILGVSKTSMLNSKRNRRVELKEDSLGLNIVEYKGVEIIYPIEFVEKIELVCNN